MRKYIGTKMVEAEYTLRVDGKIWSADAEDIPSGETVENGYRVRYADGYESFSPLDVFEKAYLPLEINENLRTDKPSISQRMVDDFIARFYTTTLGDKTTVVRAVLVNGFEIVESSSCVSPENYDEEIGKEICIGKIKDKVWYLLGFLLQTAVNGVGHPRMIEKIRDLEQEYAEQAESEQACEACEECCDCCNDTGTAEPAENKKTDNGDCTLPVDSEGNSGLDGLLGFLKDKASEAMAKKVADMDLKVLIEKTDEGVSTELRGKPVALISELVTAMAHIIADCPDKKMQESMKEAAMEELEEEIANLQKEQKKK